MYIIRGSQSSQFTVRFYTWFTWVGSVESHLSFDHLQFCCWLYLKIEHRFWHVEVRQESELQFRAWSNSVGFLTGFFPRVCLPIFVWLFLIHIWCNHQYYHLSGWRIVLAISPPNLNRFAWLRTCFEANHRTGANINRGGLPVRWFASKQVLGQAKRLRFGGDMAKTILQPLRW